MFYNVLKRAVRILFIDKFGVFDAIGSDSIVGIMGCYGVTFSDVTIVLTRDVTIVLTPMHDDFNSVSLGKQ